MQSRFFNLPAFLNYTIDGTGPLTSTSGFEGFAAVNSKYANQSDDWPDIQINLLSANPVSDDGEKVRYNEGFTDFFWDNYYAPLLPNVLKKDTWAAVPVLMRPLSRGTIRLASTDPHDKPLIDPQYFSNIQDLKVLIEGVKIGLALAKTEAFQKIGTQFYNATFPGCEEFELWTDEYWGCCIRHYSATYYHPAGTCKMGPSTDPSAVVDPELKVHNITGLRVVDASVMPYLTSGNINAPTVIYFSRCDMCRCYIKN